MRVSESNHLLWIIHWPILQNKISRSRLGEHGEVERGRCIQCSGQFINCRKIGRTIILDALQPRHTHESMRSETTSHVCIVHCKQTRISPIRYIHWKRESKIKQHRKREKKKCVRNLYWALETQPMLAWMFLGTQSRSRSVIDQRKEREGERNR